MCKHLPFLRYLNDLLLLKLKIEKDEIKKTLLSVLRTIFS